MRVFPGGFSPLRSWRSTLWLGATLGLGLAGCGGGDKPLPRSARAAHEESAPSHGGSASSFSDSAIEPAANDALKAEDWPRAEALFRELSRRQPRNPAGKRGLGVALMKQEKNDQAVEALQGSLEIGDDVRTRLDLAAAFGALGRYPSALPHLRKAVKLAPADPATWSQLADALVKVEKPDGAAEVLVESHDGCARCATDEGWGRAADETAEALDTKAEKQLAANDAAGARKNADAAAKLRPDLAATHLIEAKLARSGGETKLATTEFRKAIEGIPDAKSDAGTSARIELATLLLTEGSGAEAVKLAREVVDVRGDDAGALDTLGRACDATRDVACAKKAYEKVTKLPATANVTPAALEHARQRMKELQGKGKKGKGKRHR
jgi:Flp pilus assembly protein TadD